MAEVAGRPQPADRTTAPSPAPDSDALVGAGRRPPVPVPAASVPGSDRFRQLRGRLEVVGWARHRRRLLAVRDRKNSTSPGTTSRRSTCSDREPRCSGPDGSVMAGSTTRSEPCHQWRPARPEVDAVQAGPEAVAVIGRSQTRPDVELSRADLADLVSRIRRGLEAIGVRSGDRVAACLPNIPETLAAMLACASLGAVWTCCAPEMGVTGVLDRLAQVDPVVLLAIDGYRYGPRTIERQPGERGHSSRPTDARCEPCGWIICTRRHSPRRYSPRRHSPQRHGPRRLDALGRTHPAARPARVRGAGLRPPALRPVLLRHHRQAETHRARPRRDPAGTRQGAGFALRPRSRRPVLLVHHHRLDDVELLRLGPAGGRSRGHLRRRSLLARPRRPLGDDGRNRHYLRRSRSRSPGQRHEGRSAARRRATT